MCWMDITVLIIQIHSAYLVKSTAYANQDKKPKHQAQKSLLQYVRTVHMGFIHQQVWNASGGQIVQLKIKYRQKMAVL